jgi:multicomponent Na+:H+ antiporter subunit F
MTEFLVALSLLSGVFVGITVWTVLRRPGLFDRVIGIGIVGTKTTVLLAVTGAVFDRLDAFVDIAMTYALLNFIFTVAVAKYCIRYRIAP